MQYQNTDMLAKQENTGFVNIWNDMLNADQKPDSALFLDDYLHMNNRGYEIWKEKIKPSLMD